MPINHAGIGVDGDECNVSYTAVTWVYNDVCIVILLLIVGHD